MSKVVIFGASTFADMARYCLTHDSDLTVVAHTVDGEYLDRSTMEGLPIVPFEEVERSFAPPEHRFFAAIGPHGMNRVRASKCDEARSKGYDLVSYVSSKASVWPDLKVGPNTFIDQGSIIHPFVSLGENIVIISAGIGHHSTLHDHCYVVAATLGGGVVVGEYSFIGMNATIREHVAVGRSCVIGAGATILRDTKDEEIYRLRGTEPARVPTSRVRGNPIPKSPRRKP